MFLSTEQTQRGDALMKFLYEVTRDNLQVVVTLLFTIYQTWAHLLASLHIDVVM